MGGALAIQIALVLGPPVLPPEPSAAVPPSPTASEAGALPVRTAALSRDIVDPFAGRPYRGSLRSSDLRDPFEPNPRATPPPRVTTRGGDLLDPFDGEATAAACTPTTRQGVPIQRPRSQSQSGAPQGCATSDAPLRDPFPAHR
jgi:hypothetical protein